MEEKEVYETNLLPNRPTLSEVLKVVNLKAQIAALYEELDAATALLHEYYQAGRYDYDLRGIDDVYYKQVLDFGSPDDNPEAGIIRNLQAKGSFLKFELIDNLAAVAKGEAVWTSVAFKPKTFAVTSLKRMPDSLKGADTQWNPPKFSNRCVKVTS